MIRLPDPPNSLGDLKRWATELTDVLRDLLAPILTPQTLMKYGSRGAGRAIMAEDGSTGGDGVAIRGQWDPEETYETDELVYCDRIPEEHDDGTMAGLYQALNDVAGDPGNDHPSVDTTNWRMVARGHWGKLTMRVGNAKVLLDAGRDSGPPAIKIWNNYADEQEGSFLFDVADLALIGGGDKVVKAYEDIFCYGVVLKKITWLRSFPYDP